MKNERELIWHIRPIRRSHGYEFIPGADTVVHKGGLSDDETVLMKAVISSVYNNKSIEPGKSIFRVSDRVTLEIMSNPIGERTHFKAFMTA